MPVLKVIARVLVPGVLVLAQADTTSAADRDQRPRLVPPDGWVPGVGAGGSGRGDAASGNPETTTTSPANDCPTVLDAGVLPAGGGILSGDTLMAGDDFDGSLYPNLCGYSYGPSGHDEIWEFQVEADGRWTFDTCTIPAGWDTNLGITYDINIGCPGVGLICNGDDACGSYWESAIRDVCLQAGQGYWLIVDGWSPASYFPGTYYDVTYARTAAPCSSTADCGDDGIFCNGVSECVDGCCVEFPTDCGLEGYCHPGLDACIHLWMCYAWATDPTFAESFAPQNVIGCPGSWIGDDIQLAPGAGRELVYYKVYTQARNLGGDPSCSPECEDEPVGTPYDITTALWTTRGGGDCTPDAIIPGTRCDLTGVGVVGAAGSRTDIVVCEPNGGLPTGVILPTADEDPETGQCGVDFYLGVISWNNGAGASVTSFGQLVGGPALDDDFGQSALLIEGCSDGLPDGTWSFETVGASAGDMRGVAVCTLPEAVCCFPEGGCEMIDFDNCLDAGGTPQGYSDAFNPRNCDLGDPDYDGYFLGCDNCPYFANPYQRDCDGDGKGDACEASPDDHDGDNDGACNGVDPCPMDPNKFDPGTGLGQAPGQCGCGSLDDDTDHDGTADCIDECPNDPYRIVPGVCGCGRPVEESEDDDGDGFANCIDTCAGVDDAVFGPCNPDAIPTLSTWGLAALALTLLAVGKVYFGRRRSADNA